jgi:hypothetical protein
VQSWLKWGIRRLVVKKDGSELVNLTRPNQKAASILPNCFQHQLKAAEYLTLQLLLFVLQLKTFDFSGLFPHLRIPS